MPWLLALAALAVTAWAVTRERPGARLVAPPPPAPSLPDDVDEPPDALDQVEPAVATPPPAAAPEPPPPEPRAMSPDLPRGIRNNNPGNLRPGRSRWQGLADPSVDDSNYLIFTSAKWGLRAAAINLLNQQKLHGLTTVRGIITKWAPPEENITAAYVHAVAQRLGVAPDDQLDLLADRELTQEFVRAIVHHENGQQPYPPDQIREAVRLAFEAVRP